MEQRHWQGQGAPARTLARSAGTRGARGAGAAPALSEPPAAVPSLPRPAGRRGPAPREPPGCGPELRAFLTAFSPQTRSGAGSTRVTEPTHAE